MHARLLLDGVQAAAAAKDVASTAGAYGAHASSTSNTASNTTDSGSTAGLAGRSDEDVMRYILTRPHQYMTRPGKALCRHYDSKGSCPFRNKCLYNHPHPREMHEAWLHAQVTREQATASKKASKAAASAAAVASANGGLARPNQALLSHALPGEGLQERASRAALQQVASVGSTPLGNYTLPLRDVAAMLTRKRLLDTDNPRVTPEGQVQALVLGLPRLLRLEAHSLSGLSTVQLDVEAFNSTELQRQEAEDAVAAAIQSAGSGGGSGAAAGGEHPHPVRPHMRVCKHYARSGACPFGMKCHYNHPPPAAPVAAATAAAASAAAQAAAAQATTPAKAAMTATSTATSAAAAAASDLTTTSSSNAGAVSIPPVFGYDNKARARALAAQQYPGAASAQLNSPKRVRSSVMYQLACLPSGPLGPHTLSLKGLSVMLVKANAASQMEPEEVRMFVVVFCKILTSA